MVDIQPPGDKDYGYEFSYRYGGFGGKLFLTYDLCSSTTDKRTLLITDQENLIENTQNKKHFDELKKSITLSRRRVHNIEDSTSVVNKIYSKQLSIPNVSVAVHRSGPVPVYVLPQVYKLHFNNVPHECRIAIYPKGKASRRASRPIGIPNDKEFLQALSHKFDIILERYIEDAAERFFDIENHSNFELTLLHAKEAETILDESVETKLDKILKNKRPPKRYYKDILRLKRQLINNYDSVIFKVRLATLFARFFINELYRIVGLIPKPKYDGKLKNLIESGEDQKLFDNDNEVAFLRNIYQQYRGCRITKTILRGIDSKTFRPWIRRFGDFARFVSILNYALKDNKNNKQCCKIFLSSHAQVEVAITFRDGISGVFDELYPGQIKLLTVMEERAGLPFIELIKAKIWLSDASFVLIPKNTTTIDHQEVRDYTWMAREGCHSLLLKKDVFFVEEKGVDSAIVEKDFREMNDYLAPEARNRENNQALINRYTERVKILFVQREMEQLDKDLKSRISSEAKAVLRQRALSIIKGLLKLYQHGTAQKILAFNKKLRYPTKINKVTKLLFGVYSEKNKNVFRNQIWSAVRKRQLIIDGKYYSLIEKIKKDNGTAYKNGLSRILMALMPKPHFNDRDRKIILDAIYTYI